ncbi:MAG TPA: helix-turn-helix transcriptional regulator [Gemmataceae bacterium]
MNGASTFGAFFRERRRALKLGLREFCRLNGFDPGNVSRIERGLAPPPLAEDVLQAYADSLKLGGEERKGFFDLAAAETGRIPPELLEHKRTVDTLPRVFERLRGPRHANWARSVDLEAWADYLDARSRLPQLVRRLVHAITSSAVRMSFPAGEGTGRPGWDGLLEAAAGNAFVPEGTSVWEMGVDRDPREKAEADLKKRSKNPGGLDPSKVTFVFVTPRRWDKKSEWCREKNRLRVWKEVRAYDSADLEEWLELAPVVDLWFATLRGQRQPGVTNLDEHWAGLVALSSPALTPKVFLTSREKGIEELKRWFEGEPAALELVAGSGAEVIDLFAAYAASLPEQEFDAISARAIIVEKKEAWQTLSASKYPLILIPHSSLPVDPETVGAAVRRGHHVLVGSERSATEEEPRRRLRRVDRYELEKALIETGVLREQATKYARESGGSLTVLKRLVAKFPGTDYPAWSRAPDSVSLVPVILAGQWDESCEGDRNALERLSGRTYQEVAETAGRWLNERDTPLVQALSNWRLVSREDSWFLLAPSITAQYLDRFESVASEVLAENDPKYELPEEERRLARIRGKVLRHSERLRTGLSETLALIGGEGSRVPPPARPEGRVGRVVRRLLEGADWIRWASLSYQLPLLAEAAPEPFLEAVERDLRRGDPALKKVFDAEGDAFFSSSPHTGLLWALESLAWEASYLPRVTFILARLSELDPPDAKLANRPLNSLREIYLTWHPHTAAPVEKRIDVLDSVKKRHEGVWWKLLLKLLPYPMDTSTPTYRPQWRDWAASVPEGATTGDYWIQAEAYSRRLIESAGSDVVRLKELLRVCEQFPGPAQEAFLAHLKSLDPASLRPEGRCDLAEAIRSKEQWVREHPAFKNLAQIREHFEPDDLVAKNAWLFGSHWEVRHALEGAESNVDGTQDRVAELRRDALKNILAAEGWAGVLRLLTLATSPGEVGFALGAFSESEYEARILPTLLVSEDEKMSRFAKGFVWSRFRPDNWDWVEKIARKDWTPKERGEILLVLLFERRTWELVQKLGPEVEEYYWSHVRDIYRGQDPGDVEFSISMLLRYEQPLQAIDVLAMAIHNTIPLHQALAFDSLEKALESQVDARRRDVRYDIYRLFEWLQTEVPEGADETLEQRLATLEWRYLALLDGHPASPRTLFRIIRRDPRFFAELLALVFRSRNEPRDEKREYSAEEKAKAENAYRLLTSWHVLPGSREDREIDPEELTAWVRRARELCKESGRLEICDSRIGELLAYAPQEEDESWPCIPVRDVLEEVGSDEILHGFQIGIFNKRGMYSKSPTEGGAQERALAERYRKYAQASEVEWPRVAASLRRVAEGYEADARREDAAVELDL